MRARPLARHQSVKQDGTRPHGMVIACLGI
jgi:hypothetical protein